MCFIFRFTLECQKNLETESKIARNNDQNNDSKTSKETQGDVRSSRSMLSNLCQKSLTEIEKEVTAKPGTSNAIVPKVSSPMDKFALLCKVRVFGLSNLPLFIDKIPV